MILQWQIKALEHNLFKDGTNDVSIRHTISGWINHVQTVQKIENGQPIGLMFDNPDKIIIDKIKNSLKSMIQEYEAIYGEFDFNEDLTNEQKVNIITSKPNYKNRNQKEEQLKLEILQKIKSMIINNCNIYYEDEAEKQTKIDEINACLTHQELNLIHINVHLKLLKKKAINICNLFILNETEKQAKINSINACIDVKSMDLIVNELKNKYVI